MIVKIRKGNEFESGLDDLNAALEEIVTAVQAVTVLITKTKDGKELTDAEYTRISKLANANGNVRFVSLALLREMFHHLPP
ncbi:hypothetical protein HYT26_04930 [Candidatus Pacearchaeota archaeon]|nr:hypothetical protein [Candidatus Pacearchaeota archaeon]